MEKKNIPLKGDLTVDNAKEVCEFFLSGASKLISCMTSRKDVDGEPVLHFVGTCDKIDIGYNDGEKKRPMINIYYSPIKQFLRITPYFTSFGNVLHWSRIHRITYEIRDNKLVIKYFTRKSKNPSSFFVLQADKTDKIQIFRNRNDRNITKVVNLLENKRLPFISIFTDEDSCMLAPGITYTIRKIEDMIKYIDFLRKT